MNALLKKDLYVLTRQMRMFLLMIVVFALLPGMNMTIFAVVYSAMMPYTAMAYDERSHWDQLAGMMPYSTLDIVLSKYVLGWLFVGGTALLTVLSSTILRIFKVEVSSPLGSLLAFFVGITMLAVILPPMFRFGVEKGRMFFILVMVVVACGSAGLVMGVMDSMDAIAGVLTVALPAAAVALSAISVPLSVKCYEKHQR
jgi:ABC-2 type transport system permease protein